MEIVEADGGGAARELVSMMETLDNLHDVTLRARNAGGQIESMNLHRVVLAAASPYAKAMFKDAWKGQWRRCGCLWWQRLKMELFVTSSRPTGRL